MSGNRCNNVAQPPPAVIVVDRPSPVSPEVLPPSAAMRPIRRPSAGSPGRGRPAYAWRLPTRGWPGYARGARHGSGGLGAVASGSLKGCATVAVGPPGGPTVAAPHVPIDPVGVGLSPRRTRTLSHRRPFQGRAHRWRRDPGAALRLPPATLEQAFSLQLLWIRPSTCNYFGSGLQPAVTLEQAFSLPSQPPIPPSAMRAARTHARDLRTFHGAPP